MARSSLPAAPMGDDFRGFGKRRASPSRSFAFTPTMTQSSPWPGAARAISSRPAAAKAWSGVWGREDGPKAGRSPVAKWPAGSQPELEIPRIPIDPLLAFGGSLFGVYLPGGRWPPATTRSRSSCTNRRKESRSLDLVAKWRLSLPSPRPDSASGVEVDRSGWKIRVRQKQDQTSREATSRPWPSIQPIVTSRVGSPASECIGHRHSDGRHRLFAFPPHRNDQRFGLESRWKAVGQRRRRSRRADRFAVRGVHAECPFRPPRACSPSIRERSTPSSWLDLPAKDEKASGGSGPGRRRRRWSSA